MEEFVKMEILDVEVIDDDKARVRMRHLDGVNVGEVTVVEINLAGLLEMYESSKEEAE